MFNRRGFFSRTASAITGLSVAKFFVSPAASAVQPTCEKPSTRKYLLEFWGRTIFAVMGADGGITREQVVYIEHEVNGKRYLEVSSIPLGGFGATIAALPKLPTKSMDGITSDAMTKAFANRGELVPVGLLYSCGARSGGKSRKNWRS